MTDSGFPDKQLYCHTSKQVLQQEPRCSSFHQLAIGLVQLQLSTQSLLTSKFQYSNVNW